MSLAPTPDVAASPADAQPTIPAPRPRPLARAIAGDPGDYTSLCISLYNRDLVALDAKVSELKRRGLTKANRSALIRVALDQLDLDRVPRGL